MSNYSELLKDPRWQKKRLSIFNRDNFTCVSCRRDDRTLHVHHHYYIAGRDPWEYPDDLLVTLCEHCHEIEESFKESDEDVVKVLLSSGLLRWDIQSLINIVHSKGGGYKPSYFRKLFHKVLERVRIMPKKVKRDDGVNLIDLLKNG